MLTWQQTELHQLSMSVIGVFSECEDRSALVLCVSDSWSDRTPLHEAAYQGRLLHLRTLITQVNLTSWYVICISNPDTAQHTHIWVLTVLFALLSPAGLPCRNTHHGQRLAPSRGLPWWPLCLCQVPAGERCKRKTIVYFYKKDRLV